jgi:dipeptidyl aminopeptidase/acylaminoacyl peptidase
MKYWLHAALMVCALQSGVYSLAAQAVPAGKDAVTIDRLMTDFATSVPLPSMRWFPGDSAVVFASEGRRLRMCSGSPQAGGAQLKASWIAVMDTRSGACRLVALGRDPHISPDGRSIAFVADSGAATHIAVVPAQGGSPHAVTQSNAGIGTFFSGFAWSPDGRSLVYGFRPGNTARPPVRADSAPRRSSVVVIGAAGDRPPDSVLWTASADGTSRRRVFTAPAQLQNIVWVNDREVVLTAYGSLEYRTDNFASVVEAVDLASGKTRVIIKDAGVQGLNPSLSRDRKQIAFLYDTGSVFFPFYHRVATVPVTGGPFLVRTDSIWLHGYPEWGNDGRSIYFAGQKGALTQLYSVAATGERTRHEITRGPRSVANFALSPNGRFIAWTARDYYGRVELRLSNSDGSNERMLLNLTPEVDSLALSDVREVRWRSRDGLEIAGILIYPLGYHAGVRYPLLVDVHGGPIGGLGIGGRILTSTPLEWQMWAAKGYAILQADYRSSALYGFDQVLAERGKNAVPDKDMDDVMSGVDHVIALGIADSSRLAILGHSAGGYLTNWILTHTHRFKVGVSYEGYADQYLGYGTGMRVGGNASAEWTMLGKPWNVPANYRAASPSEFVKGVTTPTLFVSGRNGIALFHNEFLYTAWKQQDVPVQFVVYGGEGHVITRPENVRDLLERATAWVDRWSGPATH